MVLLLVLMMMIDDGLEANGKDGC
jgi:hypothetical protein